MLKIMVTTCALLIGTSSFSTTNWSRFSGSTLMNLANDEVIKVEVEFTKAQASNYQLVACLQSIIKLKKSSFQGDQKELFAKLQKVTGTSDDTKEINVNDSLINWLNQEGTKSNFAITNLDQKFGSSEAEAQIFADYVQTSLRNSAPVILGYQTATESRSLLINSFRKSSRSPWLHIFSYLDPRTGKTGNLLGQDINAFSKQFYLIGFQQLIWTAQPLSLAIEPIKKTVSNLDDGLENRLGFLEIDLTAVTALTSINRFRQVFQEIKFADLRVEIAKIDGTNHETKGWNFLTSQIPSLGTGVNEWQSPWLELGKWTDTTKNGTLTTTVKMRLNLEITPAKKLQLELSFFASGKVNLNTFRLAGKASLDTGKQLIISK